MKDVYYVIRNSDGDTSVRTYTKDELLYEINNGDFGVNGKNIITDIPHDDTNYWGENVLIIKGKAVCPVGRKVITEFDIE